MSTNGSRPRQVGWRMPGSRRVRMVIGVGIAALIVGVLVAPVVLLGSGSKQPPCSTSVLYKGHRYVPRYGGHAVEAIAVGVGVASGCGGKPTNVDLRSVERLSPELVVAIESDPRTIYVRRGICPGKQDGSLFLCLEALKRG